MMLNEYSGSQVLRNDQKHEHLKPKKLRPPREMVEAGDSDTPLPRDSITTTPPTTGGP
jgi:hypothetical protein